MRIMRARLARIIWQSFVRCSAATPILPKGFWQRTSIQANETRSSCFIRRVERSRRQMAAAVPCIAARTWRNLICMELPNWIGAVFLAGCALVAHGQTECKGPAELERVVAAQA